MKTKKAKNQLKPTINTTIQSPLQHTDKPLTTKEINQLIMVSESFHHLQRTIGNVILRGNSYIREIYLELKGTKLKKSYTYYNLNLKKNSLDADAITQILLYLKKKNNI